MCNIKEITSEHKVGYKVLARKDGKFYSSFTGQEITVGKVPEIDIHGREKYTYLSYHWNNDVKYLKPLSWSFFKPNFLGKTSAFVDVADAMLLATPVRDMLVDHSYEIVVVKITFDGVTYSGEYGLGSSLCDRKYVPCIAGDTIKSIEVIE